MSCEVAGLTAGSLTGRLVWGTWWYKSTGIRLCSRWFCRSRWCGCSSSSRRRRVAGADRGFVMFDSMHPTPCADCTPYLQNAQVKVGAAQRGQTQWQIWMYCTSGLLCTPKKDILLWFIVFLKNTFIWDRSVSKKFANLERGCKWSENIVRSTWWRYSEWLCVAEEKVEE